MAGVVRRPSILSIAVTYGVLQLLIRADLQASIQEEMKPEPLKPGGKVVLGGLVCVVVVILTASALNKDLGLPTCLAALGVTAAVSIKERSNPLKLVKEVSWATLLLVAGLFIMVNAIENQGALQYTLAALHRLQAMRPAAGALVAGLVVGIANNLLNNLPLGLVTGHTLEVAHVKGVMAHAVLIGVDLGPNLSVTARLQPFFG